MLLEPVPGAPAATATVASERALFIADYHAGYEAALRYERGVGVPSRAADRRERLLGLLERTGADRLVVLGDFMHSIGEPGGAERGELEVLFEDLPPDLAVTLIKGNHDGAIEDWVSALPRADVSLDVQPGTGVRLGPIGACHGHTWPSAEALGGDVLCLGHEHPCVRLEDEVGGSSVERAWLRGALDPEPFQDHVDEADWDPPSAVVVFPAFNELVGGTWVNVPGQSFLAPFLPAGIDGGEVYLLDGTRLGPYASV